MKKILLLTDNKQLFTEFVKLLTELSVEKDIFEFACTPGNELFSELPNVDGLYVKDNIDLLIDKYSKIFSLHSKQIFPKILVENIDCINVHPGYNPYNRGWFPQVFAILEDTVIGATIHKMDEYLDHGKIIDRIIVNKEIWDTSESLYNKILSAEIGLLRRNLINIINNQYDTFEPEFEGKLYLKNDFKSICKIDLNQKGKFLDFYNLLRALSHGDYYNAYFLTDEGKKISLNLKVKVSDKST